MEKKQTSNYGTAPWNLKKNAINSFVAVTEVNRKNAIVYGRILYVIEAIGSSYQFRGTLSVDPCFTEGWLLYPVKPWQNVKKTHYRVYMNEGLVYEDWLSANKILIDKFINEKVLYIKPTDPILTFHKE